jgi:hypothetical protein
LDTEKLFVAQANSSMLKKGNSSSSFKSLLFDLLCKLPVIFPVSITVMLVEKIERKTKDFYLLLNSRLLLHQTQRGFEQLTVIPYITENQIKLFFFKKTILLSDDPGVVR